MTLPKFKISVIGHKNIYLKTQRHCDVICGADEKMVWCVIRKISKKK